VIGVDTMPHISELKFLFSRGGTLLSNSVPKSTFSGVDLTPIYRNSSLLIFLLSINSITYIFIFFCLFTPKYILVIFLLCS
jgi:CBS domain containing-hemolysin-like protein